MMGEDGMNRVKGQHEILAIYIMLDPMQSAPSQIQIVISGERYDSASTDIWGNTPHTGEGRGEEPEGLPSEALTAMDNAVAWD
jgi:hypothetical protein